MESNVLNNKLEEEQNKKNHLFMNTDLNKDFNTNFKTNYMQMGLFDDSL